MNKTTSNYKARNIKKEPTASPKIKSHRVPVQDSQAQGHGQFRDNMGGNEPMGPDLDFYNQNANFSGLLAEESFDLDVNVEEIDDEEY